jgi:hypothetical protein
MKTKAMGIGKSLTISIKDSFSLNLKYLNNPEALFL